MRCTFAVLVLLALGWPLAATASPVSGPRETVEITFSTTQPGSPLGITYTASFHNPSNPNATPPALRRLVLGSPPGAQVDTSAPARCTATDAELKQQGVAACPPASRIGYGSADVEPLLLPRLHYTTTLFNAHLQQVELLTSNPPAPPTVVRGYFSPDGALDSPIPSCLNGGYAPHDCPSDQVALLGNTLVIPAYTTGSGAQRRSYQTTPDTCPATRRWTLPATFYYGDGAVERLTITQPCELARTRLRVRPRRVRRLARRRYRFRASVELAGRWEPLAGATIRFGGKTSQADKSGRASARIRFRHSGRRRARLSKPGYSGAGARVRVLRRTSGGG